MKILCGFHEVARFLRQLNLAELTRIMDTTGEFNEAGGDSHKAITQQSNSISFVKSMPGRPLKT